MRALTVRGWSTLGALLVLVAAIVAAACTPHGVAHIRPGASAPNPLNAELDRCERLGSQASSDASCRQAWAQRRQDFFRGEEHSR